MTSPMGAGGKPVRLQLSRKKGFNLQALSMATNGLPAVNVARPGFWGNWICVGDPGRLWIRRRAEHFVVLLEATLSEPVDAHRATHSHRRWLETAAAVAPSRGTAWLIPGFTQLDNRFAGMVDKELWQKRIETIARLPTLKGHNVACSCEIGTPCHADTLLEMANEQMA